MCRFPVPLFGLQVANAIPTFFWAAESYGLSFVLGMGQGLAAITVPNSERHGWLPEDAVPVSFACVSDRSGKPAAKLFAGEDLERIARLRPLIAIRGRRTPK